MIKWRYGYAVMGGWWQSQSAKKQPFSWRSNSSTSIQINNIIYIYFGCCCFLFTLYALTWKEKRCRRHFARFQCLISSSLYLYTSWAYSDIFSKEKTLFWQGGLKYYCNIFFIRGMQFVFRFLILILMRVHMASSLNFPPIIIYEIFCYDLIY
jgi:hypothetical protein